MFSTFEIIYLFFQDILEFINGSPNGIILFTFGSIVSISKLPENIQRIFIETLAQLPQRVLLKYEGKMENKPKNVMTKEWLPQRDILCENIRLHRCYNINITIIVNYVLPRFTVHPKVKLFISHGGISGVYETVDAGVPVLGFPLISDQWRNIDNLVEAGMAISADLMSVSKEEFFNNVAELINNKK